MVWFLGDHDIDEYFHMFFDTKDEAISYIKKHKPTGITGFDKFTEYDIEEVITYKE